MKRVGDRNAPRTVPALNYLARFSSNLEKVQKRRRAEKPIVLYRGPTTSLGHVVEARVLQNEFLLGDGHLIFTMLSGR